MKLGNTSTDYERLYGEPGELWNKAFDALAVKWQSPSETPNIAKYETETFWVAVKSIHNNGECKTIVFDAQYVNKPLELDDEGEPLDDNHFVDSDGWPMECLGWYSNKEHEEFSDFYSPITFNENYVLLGWAKYSTPDFNTNSNGGDV